MDGQTFNIVQNKFELLAPGVIRNLINDEHFTDVTLVTSDNRQLKCHKVILSSGSGFFRKVLSENTHTHPLIYLKGISYKDLQLIIRFIYLGECKVPVIEVNEFIEIGKELKVEGLQEQEDENNEEGNQLTEGYQNYHLKKESHQVEKEIIHKNYDISHEEKFSNQSSFLMDGDEDRKYPCDQCDYKSKRKTGLKRHHESVHDGIKYVCQECGYNATQISHLQKHKQSVHDGVTYDCPQCDYKATQKGNLQTHIKSVHDGVKYDCQQCYYKATKKSHLQTHIKSVHSNEKFETSWKGHLYAHMKLKHIK